MTLDTSPEAEAFLRARLAERGPAGRLLMATAGFATLRGLAAAGLSSDGVARSSDAFREALAVRLHGNALSAECRRAIREATPPDAD